MALSVSRPNACRCIHERTCFVTRSSLRPVPFHYGPLASRLSPALLPAEVDLLGEGDGSIVVGDGAIGLGVRGREGDAVVDVEDAVGAARGPDIAARRDPVVLGVDLALGPDAAARDGRLRRRRPRRVLAEEVGAEEGSSHAGVELSVAVVRRLNDGELPARGIAQRQVNLAVLAAVRRPGAGANVGLEAVEAERDDLERLRVSRWIMCNMPTLAHETYRTVRRDVVRDGPLRAAAAGGLDIGDLDFTGARQVVELQRRGGREDGEEQSGEGLHLGGFGGVDGRLLRGWYDKIYKRRWSRGKRNPVMREAGDRRLLRMRMETGKP